MADPNVPTYAPEPRAAAPRTLGRLDAAELPATSIAAATAGYAHQDGWASFLTGIGTLRDKRNGTTFAPTPMSYQACVDAWLGDDMFAKAADVLPNEAFREPYEIQASGSGIDDSDQSRSDMRRAVRRARDLGVDAVLERAWAMERALGGAIIVLGINDGQAMSAPLDLSRVEPGGFEYCSVLEPIEITPETYYTATSGPTAAKLGQPQLWRLTAMIPVTSTVGAPFGTRIVPITSPTGLSEPGAGLIHESRIIVLGGLRVSRYQRPSMSSTWAGESLFVRLHDIIRDFSLACQSVGLMVVDFSQAVMKMKNLVQAAMRDKEGLRDRMQALDMGRSVARAILIDADEEFTRETTSVTGLDGILNWLSARVAAALETPITRLFGSPPKGLGNEGDSDVRFFYDRVASCQDKKVTPWLRKIYPAIFRDLGITEPKEWDVYYPALWQLSETEQVANRYTMAKADNLYAKMGAVTVDEIRKARFGSRWSYETHVDPSQPAPGPPVPPAPAPPPGAAKPGATDGKPVPPPGHHGVAGYVRRSVVRPSATKVDPGAGAAPAADADANAAARKDAAAQSPQAADPRPSKLDAVAAALAELGDAEFFDLLDRVVEPA